MFHHLLITRFGIGVRTPSWYEYKLSLFEAITLPSICSQRREGLFWLIVIDSRIPSESLLALQAIVEAHSFIHLVSIDVYNQPRMIHGGFAWVYEQCQTYLLSEGLIEDPTAYVITSLIDDDDAWNRDTVRIVDKHIEENAHRLFIAELDARRGFLVRHTSGMFITFEKGIIWNTQKKLYHEVLQPSFSMSVFVFARFSSNISACTVRHRAWAAYLASVDFEQHILQTSAPMWVYFRHPKALCEHEWAESGIQVDDRELMDFERLFSIDGDAYVRFFNSFISKMPAHPGVPDDDKFELLDLQFRIGAVRQQILCLTERLEDCASAPKARKKIEEIQRSAIKKLESLRTRFDLIATSEK